MKKNAPELDEKLREQQHDLLRYVRDVPTLQARMKYEFLWPENLFALLRHWNQIPYPNGTRFLTELLSRYAACVFRKTLRAFPTLSTEDKEDAVMDALEALLYALHTYGPLHPRWNFWCLNFHYAAHRWIKRYAKRKLLAQSPKHRTPSDALLPFPSFNTVEEQALAELTTHEFFADLPQPLHTCLTMTLEGYSQEEIAQSLECSTRNVRYLRHAIQNSYRLIQSK